MYISLKLYCAVMKISENLSTKDEEHIYVGTKMDDTTIKKKLLLKLIEEYDIALDMFQLIESEIINEISK